MVNLYSHTGNVRILEVNPDGNYVRLFDTSSFKVSEVIVTTVTVTGREGDLRSCEANWGSRSRQQGFIAPLVEHRTGIAEVMGSNPVGASEFFLGFICNCLSYFITVKISFTSIFHPQFVYTIYIICTSSLQLLLVLLLLHVNLQWSWGCMRACVRERVCVCVRVETKDWTAYFLCVGSLSDEFFSRWTIFQEMLLLSIYVTFHL